MKTRLQKIRKAITCRENRRIIIALTTILLCMCISFAIWITTYLDEQDYLLSQKDFIASDFSNVYLLEDYKISNGQNDTIAVSLTHEGYILTCYFDKNFTIIDYHFNIVFIIVQAIVLLAFSFIIDFFIALIVLKISEKCNIIDPPLSTLQ